MKDNKFIKFITSKYFDFGQCSYSQPHCLHI